MSKDTRETYLKPFKSFGDRSANLNRFLISLETYSKHIHTDINDNGMRDYWFHLDDADLLKRHPTAVRLARPARPVEPDVSDKNYANLYKHYESRKASFLSFLSGEEKLVSAWIKFLPKSDKDHLETLDPTNGLSTVTPTIVYKYLQETYGTLAESAKDVLMATIEGPLSLSLSLQENLDAMKNANASLNSKKCGYSEFHMFNYAYSKLYKNARTKTLAEDFKKRDGYLPETASFTEFCKFAIHRHNILSPSNATAALAISCDIPTLDNTEPISAAVISPVGKIALTFEEISQFMEQASKSHIPKNKPAAPKPLKVAPGYCILHGFCAHGPGMVNANGKPAFCNTMSDENGIPLPGTPYTKEHIFCKSSIGNPIRNIARSQKVDRRFTKP